jgi:crotonobetainyl-CoA:carnitine CoA-transferase CaiB-like acyl-CoA transferase
VRRSDVVVHNVRPSKARRLGFDHASLARIRDDVVACEIAAYSDDGPYADVPGRDTLVGALSGWTLDGGDGSTGPVWLRQMVGDTATSGAALIATLLGLYHRERTGKGGRVSASLLRTACAYSSETMLRLDDGTVAPFAASLPGAVGLSPEYRIYEAADGWLAVATDGSRLGRLCAELQVAPSGLVDALHARRIDEALACCEQVRIAAEAVDADPEHRFFSDRANHDRGLVNVYEHPRFGTVSHPFGYWDLAPMACVGGVAAPLLGQHTTNVLREVGCTERDIAMLSPE